MDNTTFRGKLSGFLYIGKEDADYIGDTLISYIAGPYGSNDPTITWKDGFLTICDVSSPTSEKYDCIWEQEDIESVMDKLRKFTLAKVSCSTIESIVIPGNCIRILSGAFDNCKNLKEIVLIGKNTEPENGSVPEGVNIICHKFNKTFSYVKLHQAEYEDISRRLQYCSDNEPVTTDKVTKKQMNSLADNPEWFEHTYNVLYGKDGIVSPDDVKVFDDEY